MGTSTCETTPSHFTRSELTRALPISPPISACEDDAGRPNHQVARFHAMAPSRAASTTTNPPRPDGGSMIPPPTVRATLVEIRAPATFIRAAMISAARGVSALVETTRDIPQPRPLRALCAVHTGSV